ncbi:hypothetical protein SAY87_003220 [Trapa incisa]|uniref:RIN4 pathogenic type III effector avirulence factor Avr cleavage site domain-containing protein n=1 Tax=Trapa incisa TaxID=236973 RepID=A0AAN7QHQ9_9MYRT|nr:hypothetical protein SAY87_003220 [Trapa incisa]
MLKLRSFKTSGVHCPIMVVTEDVRREGERQAEREREEKRFSAPQFSRPLSLSLQLTLLFLPPSSIISISNPPFLPPSPLSVHPISVPCYHLAIIVLSIMAPPDRGRPLPKFGDWDVNNPASAEGFTLIFNKARDEKKTSGATGNASYAQRSESMPNKDKIESKSSKKNWFCCGFVRVQRVDEPSGMI